MPHDNHGDGGSGGARSAAYRMPPELFFRLFPFHMIINTQGKLLQVRDDSGACRACMDNNHSNATHPYTAPAPSLIDAALGAGLPPLRLFVLY